MGRKEDLMNIDFDVIVVGAHGCILLYLPAGGGVRVGGCALGTHRDLK